ncbi:F-box protein At2g26160-like [Olea europaea var. sylvestris]|uniref:KIB1-4 beta-propeller domain-containing protein n=1 Tax=Olea europaea subsp. europaea TaxID=158383 RepID=A0A8S0SA96_OLEEU|nr:F-box protein At2g26160-like [Olea europaea var. sylvestris]CAA2989154.1 Hypothetical predicted protein [Olea europaea subsp. europaea]
MKFPLLIFSKEGESCISFFSLTEKSVFQLDVLQSLKDCRCVGSSHGWLVILNEKSDPFLVDIVSETRFQLPGKETFPHIQAIREIENEEFEIKYKREKDSFCYSLKTLQEWLMVKAILSGIPSCNTKYTVITMYNLHCKSKLALCRPGDNGWTGLLGEHESYDDIICHENLLCALGYGPSVEIWDLNESTQKSKMIIQVPCPRNLIEARKFYPRDLYTSKWYLVSSCQDLFLVMRYIGEFVRYDGEVIYEGDTLTDYTSQPLVCPYKTVGLNVYKLDCKQKKWLQVETLNDVALFIGGNHSASVLVKEYPGCKASAIYFTDDYWDRMDEDIYYGGHDMGVFLMKDGSIEPFFDCDQERFEPPPFWMVPN